MFGGVLAMVLMEPTQERAAESVVPELNYRYRTLDRKYQALENQKQLLETELTKRIVELQHKLSDKKISTEEVRHATIENVALKEKLSIVEQVKESLTDKLHKQTENHSVALQEMERLRKQSQLEVISLKAEIGQLKVQLSSLGHFQRSTPISTHRQSSL